MRNPRCLTCKAPAYWYVARWDRPYHEGPYRYFCRRHIAGAVQPSGTVIGQLA